MASTNDITPGLYRVYNAYSTGYCLDVDKASTANRAYVYGHAPNYSDAQVWELSYRADGTAQILYRFAGKALEVYGATSTTVKPGQQLSIFTDNDTDAQQWNLNPTGSTVTISGTSYDTYMIQLDFETAYAATLDTSTSTRPVKLQTPDTSDTKQAWAFVPIEKYRDGGLYEIHSIMDTSMLFDVNGLSKANGANLQLHVPNGGNNQKFVLEAGAGTYAGYWAIRSVYSGKYMHTASSAMKDGVNVHQWEGTATPNAWWKITEYGTKTINGTDCQVVSFGNKNNTAYLIDAAYAKTANRTNLMVNHNNQGANQEWALMPTEAIDETMPTPYNLGITYTVGDTKETVTTHAAQTKDETVTIYPTWTCPASWANGKGSNHYRIRSRRRYLINASSSWTAWGEWTAWETAAVTIDGQRSWLTKGVTDNYDRDTYREMEYEYQVSCVGCDELGLSSLYGPTADVVISLMFKPTIELSNAGWSIDGLTVDYTSDYNAGTNVINVKSITTTDASGETHTAEFEDSEMVFKALDAASSITIGTDYIIDSVSTWPADDSPVIITYTVGTDQWPEFGPAQSTTLTLHYDAGHDADVTPTLAIGPGRTLLATCPQLGTAEMWLSCDNTLIKLEEVVTSDESTATFSALYPFGRDFKIWTTSISADHDTWGTDLTEVSTTHPLISGVRPCHAWNWADGGYFVLELQKDDPQQVTRTLNAEYESYVLNSRKYEAVAFGETVKSAFSVTGSIVEGMTESTRADVESLLGAQHVTYRSPFGDVVDVAITSIDYTTNYISTEVEVSMIEETV